MKTISLLIIFSIFLLNINTAFAGDKKKAPVSSDVKKELKYLLEKYNANNGEVKQKRQILPPSLKIPPIVIKIFFYMVMAALIIGLIIGIYSIIQQNSSTFYRKNRIKNKTFEETIPADLTSFKELYQESLHNAKQGNLNKATILLHWASVAYLVDNLIIQRDKEYTNNDLKKLLKNNDIFSPFVLIAKYAEIAAFSGLTLNNKAYTEALQNFESGFLTN